jgi:hypothetical protein
MKTELAELLLFAALLLLAGALAFGNLLTVILSIVAIICAAAYLGSVDE